MRTTSPATTRKRRKERADAQVSNRIHRHERKELYQKEGCTKEYKLTKEPSLNMDDRSSERALAHHESKSSTIKGKSHSQKCSSVSNENEKGRATRKSVAHYRNQKGKSHLQECELSTVIKKGRVVQ